jgi:hypothetical protein
MTGKQFTRAIELNKLLNTIESELNTLDRSEEELKNKNMTQIWTLFNVNFNKNQILSVLKYNREVLNNRKKELNKQFINI